MKKTKPLITFLLVLMLANLACIIGSGVQPAGPNNATSVAMTLTAIALQNPPSSPGLQPAPPSQPAQENQPVPPSQPASPPTGIPPTIATPCDRATFVTETIPDGTKMSPGQEFSKTWTLKNNGSCSWVEGYTLVFDHGDAMGALPISPLTASTIAPGQDVQMAAHLTAPNQPGTYQGFFKLQNKNGARFGLGDNGDVAFWVKIVVEGGASTSDEAAIKQALLAKMGWPESELEFSISQNTGQFAQGSLRNVNEPSGAAWFAAKNSSGQWVIAYIGQGIPTCSEIQPYNLPKDWISHCMDASGNTVER